MIGGRITSRLLTLIGLPTLYAWFERARRALVMTAVAAVALAANAISMCGSWPVTLVGAPT